MSATTPTVESSSAPTSRYVVFSKGQRWYIVVLIAGAGWFSTLSSFIYYPILSILAEDLHTSIARINFTVTSYLAVSGVAPSIAGDAADMFGRRPVYLVSLSLYFCANIGIALQKSFVALLLLRMLQSAGISGTFSVAYGVIADIATPAERGAFVGVVSFGITTAPSFGPLVGGVLAYRAGWRWIFWLLSIMSALVLILIVLSLPETARSVVGNGTNAPPKWSTPLIPNVMRPWENLPPEPSTIIHRKKGFPNPLKALIVLSRPDTAISITAGSILYMIFCASHASLSTVLIDIYNLNELEAGLIYLPYGVSCLVSTLMSGKLIDRDYQIVARKHNFPINKVSGDDLSRFPIEEARMRSIFVPTFLAMFSMIGYGWAVHYHAHLSIPLILQFFIGLGIQTYFNYNNTLLVDINHEAPATAQASFNLVRCIMAALATGVIHYMIDGIGLGWSFTIFGGSAVLSALLYFVEMKQGMRWRVGSRKGSVRQIALPGREEPAMVLENVTAKEKATIKAITQPRAS